MMALSPDDLKLFQEIMKESRSIDPVIYGLLATFGAIIGYFCKRMIDKIDFLEKNSATKSELVSQCDMKHRRLDDLKSELVTKEHCDLTSQLNIDRFQTINFRLDKAHVENKEGHEEIKTELKSIGSSIKELVDCVTRLSAGVTCE